MRLLRKNDWEEKEDILCRYLPEAGRALGFVITSLGKTQAFPAYHMGPYRTPEHKVFLITNGKGWLRSAEATFTMSKGDVAILFKDVTYEWWTDERDLLHKYWVCFRGPGAAYLLQQLAAQPLSPVIHRNHVEPEEVAAVESLLAFYREHHNSGFPAIAGGYELFFKLYGILQQSLSSLGTEELSPEDPIATAKSYIDLHYREKLSLADIARDVFLTPEYLSTAFKKRFGVSPYSYVLRKRLAKAKALLQAGTSVKEAALSVGYRNPNYFSHLFHKKEGMPPSAVSAEKRRGGPDEHA